jgi:hypothetical protein
MSAGFTVWFTGLSGSASRPSRATSPRPCEPAACGRGHRWRRRPRWPERRPWLQPRRPGHAGPPGGLDVRAADPQRVIALAALVSPYETTRAEVRAAIGRCIVVYVEAPLATLESRDTKGLYRDAAAGRVTDLTGVGILRAPARCRRALPDRRARDAGGLCRPGHGPAHRARLRRRSPVPRLARQAAPIVGRRS